MTATHSPHRMSFRQQRGFTLIELLVAFFIGVFVIGMTITVMDFSVRNYRTQERVADIQQDVRAALEIIARDVRMAGFNPRRGSGATIVEAKEDLLAFQLDSDMDNTVTTGSSGSKSSKEFITYSFDAQDRVIRCGGNNHPLISNVSNLQFSYFDENGDALDPANDIEEDIRRVRISLTCRQRDTRGKPFGRTLTTNVTIRNRVILPRKGIL